MIDQRLVQYIAEARRRGFTDAEIRKPLISNGWTPDDIKQAFSSTLELDHIKNEITLHLDSAVLHAIEKRARKNLLSVSEQIEDILRRSVVNASSRAPKPEKLDDLFLTFFSRRSRKR